MNAPSFDPDRICTTDALPPGCLACNDGTLAHECVTHWRVATVARSHNAHDGAFVAEIYQGTAWVARVKCPIEDATGAGAQALAERVCAAMNATSHDPKPAAAEVRS